MSVMADAIEWVLMPNEDRECDDLPDPWQPWYDKCFKMVVRAETEQEARNVAQEHGKDETSVSPVHHNVDDRIRNRSVWTDSNLTECIPLHEYKPNRSGEHADDNRILIQSVQHA
jgi:hypothetical protein